MNTLFEQQPEYRVLNLWQPWASLLVHGIKKIETRPGPTSWTAEKGVYLIHATSKWSKEQMKICLQEPFLSSLIEIGVIHKSKHLDLLPVIDNLPLGKIIGSIEVESCHRIHNENYDLKLKPHLYMGFNDYTTRAIWKYIDEPEKSFGNYLHGRYAWLCKNQRVLKEPIPYKGGQGYYQKFKGDINQLKFV